MTDFTSINYSAVIVASLVYYIIGFLWYSKLFGDAWRSETRTPAEPRPGPAALIGQFGSTLLYVLGIAAVFKLSGMTGIVGGIYVGLFVTVLFALPINSGNLFFTGKRRLFFLDVGERLLGSLVVGGILGAWS
jgi:hypothetical protein